MKTITDVKGFTLQRPMTAIPVESHTIDSVPGCCNRRRVQDSTHVQDFHLILFWSENLTIFSLTHLIGS